MRRLRQTHSPFLKNSDFGDLQCLLMGRFDQFAKPVRGMTISCAPPVLNRLRDHRRRKAVRAHGGDDHPPAIEQICAGTPAPAKDGLSSALALIEDQQRLQVRSFQNRVAQPSTRGDQFSRPSPRQPPRHSGAHRCAELRSRSEASLFCATGSFSTLVLCAPLFS